MENDPVLLRVKQLLASGEWILDPKNVVPFSKNPVIAKFFAQLSWVEEIGSGMMNIGKYLPHYTPGGIPEYRDGPVFTTIVPIPTGGRTRDAALSGKRRENVGKDITSDRTEQHNHHTRVGFPDRRNRTFH